MKDTDLSASQALFGMGLSFLQLRQSGQLFRFRSSRRMAFSLITWPLTNRSWKFLMRGQQTSSTLLYLLDTDMAFLTGS